MMKKSIAVLAGTVLIASAGISMPLHADSHGKGGQGASAMENGKGMKGEKQRSDKSERDYERDMERKRDGDDGEMDRDRERERDDEDGEMDRDRDRDQERIRDKDDNRGMEKQRERVMEQEQKEMGKGSEQGQESREQRRKWWRFWE